MKPSARLYVPLLLGVLPFIFTAPTTMKERETPCVALGTCPSLQKGSPVAVIGTSNDAALTTIKERETPCFATSSCPSLQQDDPATVSSTAVTVIGAPDDEVSCPVPLQTNTFQHFTKDYVPNNIIDIVASGTKGSYPKDFDRKNPKSGQFEFLNGCGDSDGTILELPMYIEDGNEVFWSRNSVKNNNSPGAFREYYILNGNQATYCGAYAHVDFSSAGDFVACH